MKKTIIWYLHHYAGSPSLGMSYRPYYLCKEFNKHNYKTYIIGASFHHLQNTPLAQHQPVQHQLIDSQDYIFLKAPYYKGNGYKRFLNMFTYAWRIWRYKKNLVKITGTPSVIIVSSAHPFHYLSARNIAQKCKARLIFEVRDLWPVSLIELHNISHYHPVILLIKWIEKFAYKNSTYVVSLLPYALPYMTQRGLNPERFVYIPNGIDDELDDKIALPESYEQLIKEKKEQGLFLIGYTGAHGVTNALEDLLNALIILKKDNFLPVHFFLVGNGCEKEKLRMIANNNQLSSITFLDCLSKKQIITFLEKMDAVYLGWKDKSLYNYGISPNKIFDYMLSAKPILHITTSQRDIVSETQSGLSVIAVNPVEIANGIKKIVGQPKEELQAMGMRGKKVVLTSFLYENLGKRYIKLFENEINELV